MRTMVTIYTILILVFGLATNNVNAQVQIGLKDKLLQDIPEDGAQFGSKLAFDGNTAIITNKDNAFIFEFDGNAWLQKQKLFENNLTITSVAMEGEVILLSTANEIYVFNYNGLVWVEAQRIPATIAINSVALSGNTMIFGGSTSAYIYDFNGTLWVEKQVFTYFIWNSGFSNEDFLSVNAVDIYQDIAIIGAKVFNYIGGEQVVVYRRTGDTWVQDESSMIHDSNSPSPAWGSIISLHENSILVGVPAIGTGPSAGYGGAHLHNWNGSDWIRTQVLLSDEPIFGDQFGQAVGIDDNFIIVGNRDPNTGRGSAHIFEFDGTLWQHKSKFLADADDNSAGSPSFASVLAVDQNRALIGAPYYNVNDGDGNTLETGASFFYEFMAQPRNVKAADGESKSQVRISWDNLSGNADGFKIYRDGIEIGSTVLAANAFYDIDAIPGKLYKYEVTSYNNTWGESSPSIADYGWRRANGRITGAIQTEQGAGIKDVDVSVSILDSTLGSSLNFDSADDLVFLPFIPLPDTLTISAWIKTSSSNNQQILGWGNTGNTDAVEFKTLNGTIAFKIPTTNGDLEINGSTRIDDGDWQHVAATINNSTNSIKLYVNGVVDRQISIIVGQFNADVNILTIGAYETSSATGLKTFNGGLDDVQLWQRELTAEEIQANMHVALKGDESGLLAFWPLGDFERSPRMIAADYAQGGNHHGKIFGAEWSNQSAPVFTSDITDVNGNYNIDNLFYNEKRDFRITPKSPDHEYDPAYRDVALESGVGPFLTFKDTTVFTVSGQILFEGESCPVEGVELLLNDQTTGIFTDSEGKFQIAIEEPGKTYKITPQLSNGSTSHTFSPSSKSVFVNGDLTGINFDDTQEYTLSGRVRGGCIAGLGFAKMRITSLKNPQCLDRIITTDFSGNYRRRLPAQEYIVDLISIDNPDSVNILKYIDADTVDLTWEGNYPTPNYIYHPRPLVRLEILPSEFTCDRDPNVPIMEKYYKYSVLIDVLEAYGPDTCHVEVGSVTIYDDIGGNPAEPTVIQLENGRAIYNIIAGEPNILGGGEHPNEKLLQIVAKANGYTVDFEQWALVTGSRPRTQTFFSTATPELPFMILRDPPGDQSYSFLSKSSTYSFEFSTSFDTTYSPLPEYDYIFGDPNRPYLTNDLNYNFDHEGTIESIGGSLDIKPFGIGAGVSIETDFGFYDIDAWSIYKSKRDGKESGNIISLTMSEELKTSDSQLINGEKGDVFIGASINQTFYLADVIKYDATNCQVVRDTSLVVDYTGYKSIYIYTEDHIRNVLLPQLKELLTLAEPDSVHRYINAISVWQQVLQQNKDSKKLAKTKMENNLLPDPSYLLEKNISFSGGTSITQTSSLEVSEFNSISYSTILEGEFLVGDGDIAAGGIYEQGFAWKYNSVSDTTQRTTFTEENIVGFTLADDDDGDYFSVDVLHDPIYGTPVFNLVAGASSCPWEPGTQPRDGAFLGINSFIQSDVPPDEPATFNLTLGNISESGEDRPYDLRVVQLSNPDGAIIKVGGVPMGDALSYYIPAGDSSYKATLTVERGPLAYDYDNLQLILVPPCEYDLYRGISTPQADTVTFSVSFASPLTKANLSHPTNNWEIDPDEPNSLAIVIDEYNRNNEYLESVQLQYRKPDGSWKTAFDVTKDQLTEQQLRRSWNLQDIPDGEYELRAVSNGGPNGMRYSPVANGVIERNTMLVRGNPEPADRILNIGEEISISFASGIDVDKLVAQRDISLIDATDSTLVDFSISVLGNKLIIQPDSSFSYLGEKTLVATVYNLTDKDGKSLGQPLSWQFQLSQQPAYWKSFASELKMYQGIDVIHTAVLYNAGSTEIDYKIDYLPQWLSISADQLSGPIAPGTEMHLTFTSGNISSSGMLYDSLSVILGGKRESRPLSLNVLTAPPNWSLAVVSNGAYTAQVYTQLLLDEKLSADTFDFAGVFINGQLSGMGHVRLDDMTGKYVAAFKIYSQTASAGVLDFRLWDASQGKEYRFYSDEFIFQAGSSVGSRLDPLIIQPNEIFQSIQLSKGVNWLSFNVTSSDLSLDRVLKDWPAQPGDVIKSQFGFSQYSEENGWIGTLDRLSPELGYRLNTSHRSDLITAGTQANLWVSPASLNTGWNWVGYLPEKELAVKDALYFMQAVPGDVIKSQNQSAIFNNNGEWLGTLREMHPGQSYSIYTQANTSLIYPELKKQTGSEEHAGLTVDPHAFESNMTVTAAITFDGADYGDSSYVVSAYVDGQLRGVGHPRYVPHLDRYITFLMIYGDSEANGESVQIQLYNTADNVTRDVEADLVFTADAHNGDILEPLALNAMQTLSERVPTNFYMHQNYPNPFNPLTTIEYGLPVDEVVTVTIYDILGQQVSVLVDERQEAGRYKLQFDAGSIGMASGIYFYQIRTSAFVKSHKMLLLK